MHGKFKIQEPGCQFNGINGGLGINGFRAGQGRDLIGDPKLRKAFKDAKKRAKAKPH